MDHPGFKWYQSFQILKKIKSNKQTNTQTNKLINKDKRFSLNRLQLLKYYWVHPQHSDLQQLQLKAVKKNWEHASFETVHLNSRKKELPIIIKIL